MRGSCGGTITGTRCGGAAVRRPGPVAPAIDDGTRIRLDVHSRAISSGIESQPRGALMRRKVRETNTSIV